MTKAELQQALNVAQIQLREAQSQNKQLRDTIGIYERALDVIEVVAGRSKARYGWGS